MAQTKKATGTVTKKVAKATTIPYTDAELLEVKRVAKEYGKRTPVGTIVSTNDAVMKPGSKSKSKTASKSDKTKSTGTPIPYVDPETLIEDSEIREAVSSAATRLIEISQTTSELKIERKDLESLISDAIASGRVKTEIDGMTVSKYPSSTSWIDKDTLLKRGVDIDIIVEATKKSEFTRIDVKIAGAANTGTTGGD